jgi:hypothetical protein
MGVKGSRQQEQAEAGDSKGPLFSPPLRARSPVFAAIPSGLNSPNSEAVWPTRLTPVAGSEGQQEASGVGLVGSKTSIANGTENGMRDEW